MSTKYSYYENDGQGAPDDDDAYADTLAQGPNPDDMPSDEEGHDDDYDDDEDGSDHDGPSSTTFDAEGNVILKPRRTRRRTANNSYRSAPTSSTAKKETEEEALARDMAALEAFTFDQPEDVRSDASGKAAYIAACKQLDGGRGVVLSIPVESVLEKFDRERMVLDHAGLGDRGLRALSEALAVNQTVTSLSLAGNDITAAGCYYLCEMLINNKNIKHLDLSDNQLGKHASVSPDGGAGLMLSQLFARNNTIISLSLRGNQIGDADATHICRALAEHRTVQKLDLSHNNIKYKGACEIASMISSNSEMLYLDLSWNQFSSLGSLAVLNMNTGLGANNTIKVFKMAWNGVDDTSADTLAKSIAGSVLEEVDISHNRITEKGADAIAKALGASGSSAAIETLNFNDNPLKDVGCASILESLRSNRSLKYISLLQTGCGKKALEAASQTLRERPELTIVVPERIALA